MIRQNFHNKITKIVKNYLTGQYSQGLTVFQVVLRDLAGVQITEKEQKRLDKLLKIFFLGQLCGLPTLNAVLDKTGIKNKNKAVTSYQDFCKRLKTKQLQTLFDSIFEGMVYDRLSALCAKDPSWRSRELATVVLDDSVYKQHLNTETDLDGLEDCYGVFLAVK